MLMASHFDTPPRSQKITFMKTDLYSPFSYLNCKNYHSYSQFLETNFEIFTDFHYCGIRKFLMCYMGLMEVITYRLSDRLFDLKGFQSPL